MALLMIDGFDEYGSIAEMISSYTSGGAAWTIMKDLGGYVSLNSSVYRTTQNGVTSKSFRSNYGFIAATLPASAEIIFGFGFQPSGAGDTGLFVTLSNGVASGFSTSPTNGIYLRRNTDGSIAACKCSDNTVFATSAAAATTGAVWNYIEVRYKAASSGGSIEVRVDNTTVINFSGDTSAGLTTMNCLALGCQSSQYFYYDDVYVCDSTGTTNNSFLGPIQVYTMVPTSDNSVQMTPSTGSSNFALVDEVPANTTDFVTGTAINQTDLYGMSDLPASITTAAIPGVVVKARSQKPNSNNGNLQLVTNYSAVTATSPSKAVPTSTWINNHQVFETQPDSSAWTVAAVNGLNAGIKTT